MKSMLGCRVVRLALHTRCISTSVGLNKSKFYVPIDHGVNDTKTWHPDKVYYRQWRKEQGMVKKVLANQVPERFKKYDEELHEVVTFQKQLEALDKRGFLRAYKPYDPPADLDQRFVRVCAETIPDIFDGKSKTDLKSVVLDRDARARVLKALEKEFNHSVPNSLLHTITSLDNAFLFFSTKVDVRTPYEKLYQEKSKGNLPPNLHIQLNPKRFDPSDEGKFGISAFPRSNTIMVTPEARKKYKDIISEHDAWKYSGKKD